MEKNIPYVNQNPLSAASIQSLRDDRTLGAIIAHLIDFELGKCPA